MNPREGYSAVWQQGRGDQTVLSLSLSLSLCLPLSLSLSPSLPLSLSLSLSLSPPLSKPPASLSPPHLSLPLSPFLSPMLATTHPCRTQIYREYRRAGELAWQQSSPGRSLSLSLSPSLSLSLSLSLSVSSLALSTPRSLCLSLNCNTRLPRMINMKAGRPSSAMSLSLSLSLSDCSDTRIDYRSYQIRTNLHITAIISLDRAVEMVSMSPQRSTLATDTELTGATSDHEPRNCEENKLLIVTRLKANMEHRRAFCRQCAMNECVAMQSFSLSGLAWLSPVQAPSNLARARTPTDP